MRKLGHKIGNFPFKSHLCIPLQMYEKEQYEAAVSYYTASIAVFPLVAAFNNRAQCREY